MDILAQSYEFLQKKILPHIDKKHRGLFMFGFEALTIRSYVSLNANARMTIAKRCTAQTKIWRLVKNKKILSYFGAFVGALGLVGKCDKINVDFSTFCGFQVLTFAKQTHLGRAIPVYIATITYPIEDIGSQTRFVISEINKFVKIVGFCPQLVFDRGFESPYIVPHLVANNLPFVLRVKSGKSVKLEGLQLPLRNLPWWQNDAQIIIYGQRLRIIRSEEKKGVKEPWYILTNDRRASRNKIVAIYYFRFEIEESFKDIKHVFDLKNFYKIQKEQTFKILLWFLILGLWFTFTLIGLRKYLAARIQTNSHKKLSLVKYFVEQVQLALFGNWKLGYG